MKMLSYIFLLISATAFSLTAQSQYTSVPRSGEGRFDRADNTAFWVNPIFLKPSVFFSSTETSQRANRKWWRNDKNRLPKPYTAHRYLSEDIALKEDEAMQNSTNDLNWEKLQFMPNFKLQQTVPRLEDVNIRLTN